MSLSVLNLFVFYLFFEFLVFPLFFLIGFFGSRGRKIHAAYNLFFYTLLSSVLIFFSIFFLFSLTNSIDLNRMFFFVFNKNNVVESYYVCLFLLLGFLSKVPVIPFHLWLPEAHVEAHTVGSVILAGIILKFSLYAILRFLLTTLDMVVYYYYKPYFLSLLIFSFCYASILACCQIDFKKLIAYSSISHMSLSFMGFFTFSKVGLCGCFVSLISHGFIAAALFFLVGFLYERFHTRNIFYYGGLVQFMPIYSTFFFFFILSNIGFPGLISFVGEYFLFFSFYQSFGFFITLSILVITFFITLFSFILFLRINFYQITGFLKNNLLDIKYFEFLILINLLFFTVIFGFCTTLLSDLLNPSISINGIPL